ncbi:MAG: pyridoxal-phosphate dependent enzyme [Chloroflexi bacterium]|nr:pyridoxal-phosphate dependent enzyme [Chloroflexota bacterium]
MIPAEWVDQADARIAPHIVRTPLTHDAARNLYIKWENHQKTGSFKARGALNRILAMTESERSVGIVTASAGNHGQGVALAGQLTGARVTCFVSEHAAPVKVDAIRALGAQIVAVQGGYPEAEAAGRKFAEENRKTWVSPYNDEWVIAGQGTVGLEILNQLPPSLRGGWLSRRSNPLSDGETASSLAVTMGAVDRNNISIYVPLSGGGLLAGIGLALARLSPRPRLVGVQPETAPFMHGLFYRGSQDGIPDLPSLADGLTGAVEADSITISMVKALVDEIVLISEEEIARAVAFAYKEYGEVIEASGAVTIAAALRDVNPSLAIVSGGNIQPEVHARIVADYTGEAWA